jgi:hypothetical protein
VNKAIKAVRDRAELIQKQVEKEISDNKNTCAPECYIKQLQELEELLKNMIKDADGTSNLELYKARLSAETAATAWHRRTVFDAELKINTQYRFKNSETVGFALDAPRGEAMEAMFHEMTHLSKPYSDHGEGGNPFLNAMEIDELSSRDLDTLTVIKAARKGIYPCK